MNKERLRIGLLIDSYEVPAWIYYSIERVVNSDSAEILLVILNQNSFDHASRMERHLNNRKFLVYTTLSKIDETLFRQQPDAFEIKNLEELLLSVPSVSVKTLQREQSEYFPAEDIENIKDYKLDILIKMGFSVLRGDILHVSKYGVWSLHHGNSRVNRGGPPGFWETFEKHPVTGATLQILSDDLEEPKVLSRSWLPTNLVSPRRNKNLLFWASSTLLSRQMERLYLLGKEQFYREIEKEYQEYDFFCKKEYKKPHNAKAITLSFRYFGRLISEFYKKLTTVYQWYLMFDLGQEMTTSLYRYKSIVPPKDRYWADPHIVHHKHNYIIFIEEYIYSDKKAHISAIEMDERGNFSKPVPVLEKGYHLSYPFVFEWHGKYYMVPETPETKAIELYECVDFPHVWEFKMNLMENVNAFDATLLNWHEKWWLFVGMDEVPGIAHSSELFIFYSRDLFSSKWTPHPLNPVVSDVRNARPAGRIFVDDGKIYRPSQDCSVAYGNGFNINKVERLSETEFAERRIVSVKPNWHKKLVGTHTFAHEGQLTIIDVCKTRHLLTRLTYRKTRPGVDEGVIER